MQALDCLHLLSLSDALLVFLHPLIVGLSGCG